MDKCEECIGRNYCSSKCTFSAWCKNMDKFRIFGKTFIESKALCALWGDSEETSVHGQVKKGNSQQSEKTTDIDRQLNLTIM